MSSTFFCRWSSINGPLLSERPMLLLARHPHRLPLLGLSGHDPLIRALVIARLETARGLAPRCHRMASAAGLAFTAAVRVIHRVHRNAAVVRTLPHPALASRLAQADVFVFHIAHLA